MQKLIVALVLFSSFCACTAAQTQVLPDQFGSWQADSPVKMLKTEQLGASFGPLPRVDQVLHEAGITAIEQRTYRSGQDQLTLRLFLLRDPSSAYEFYTFLLAPGMQNLGITEDSALGQQDARLLIGNLVVEAELSAKARPESLDDLIPALKPKADPTPLPPLKSYLPTRWRVFGSEKYSLGPEAFRAGLISLDQGAYADLAKAAGFDNGAEAIIAKYQGEHGSGVLLLIEYPTPQVAENHRHHLEQALPESAKQSGVTVERKASMLSLVFAATSALHAKAIRDEVNYETEVTWNEPGQTATDPPIVVVMFKIFLFTTEFLVVATLVGIAFGGFRILIKHWLPGKIFDRPQDIEVLQLGLSGKKIDPTDMY